jgi:hypothetical protein
MQNFILHAVSMTPHASCMRCYWYRIHLENFEFLREFEFIGEKLLNQGPRTDVLIKKNRGLKISWHCPFKENVKLRSFHKALHVVRCGGREQQRAALVFFTVQTSVVKFFCFKILFWIHRVVNGWNSINIYRINMFLYRSRTCKAASKLWQNWWQIMLEEILKNLSVVC